MKRDLFINLPEELTIDILGRLPSEIIIKCKSVCKSWLDLIEGGKFVTSYTPKPCLGFSSEHMYTVYEDDASEPLFKISLNPPHVDCGYNSRCRVVIDSADGLLFVRDSDKNLSVVNPMTRDYVRLPPPCTTCSPCIFGFGVSKISRQYKILCGLEDSGSCHVYTLGGGGGSWRSISAPSSPAGRILPITLCDVAAFFNGNLHWLFKEEYLMICCFDLETELFTVFSPPPLDYGLEMHHEYRLCTLEGQLRLCECKGCGNIDIWRMNSYGDDNSWEREYTFDLKQRISPTFGGLIFPLKVLDNGDLWFTVDRSFLYIYSINTESAVLHNPPPQCSSYLYSDITTYTPSFLSLKAMGIPNVQSLRLRPQPPSSRSLVSYHRRPRRKAKLQRRLID